MTWGFVAVGVGTAAGAGIGAMAAGDAADTQAAAAQYAADLQYKQFQESTKLQEPWRNAGVKALNQLIPLSMNYTPFGMNQFRADPGYQFRLDEGLNALDKQAAARGGLISGRALKAAARYGQDYASNEYTNAFNRYQTERNARLAPLQSLAGVGQTTAANQANQGMTMASNVGDAYQNAANARASGYVGQANAIGGGISQGVNYLQNQQLMNRLLGPPTSGGGPGFTNAGGFSSAGLYTPTSLG
jgi:hypothetical protein